MADAERLVQGRRVDRQNLIRQNHHSVLFGGKDVRVVTIGYQMEGWEPDWAERVLDLTVFKYEMKILDNDPEEWRLGYKEDEAAGFASTNNLSTVQQRDEEQEQTMMQQQKQQ